MLSCGLRWVWFCELGLDLDCACGFVFSLCFEFLVWFCVGFVCDVCGGRVGCFGWLIVLFYLTLIKLNKLVVSILVWFVV